MAKKPLVIRYLLIFSIIPIDRSEIKYIRRDILGVVKAMGDAIFMVNKITFKFKKLKRGE